MRRSRQEVWFYDPSWTGLAWVGADMIVPEGSSPPGTSGLAGDPGVTIVTHDHTRL
jgi:hypothetical protein